MNAVYLQICKSIYVYKLELQTDIRLISDTSGMRIYSDALLPS